jgi:hypothetical protein
MPVATFDSPRSAEVVTLLGSSVVGVTHRIDPKTGMWSRMTRGLLAGGALALVAAAVAFGMSVSAARADDRAFDQWTRVDHKPAAQYHHHNRLGGAYDAVAFGGLALGLGAIAFGIARARRERTSPYFRIGTAPGVDQPVEGAPAASFPLVAPRGDDFVLNYGTGIDGELIDETGRTPLAALAAAGRSRPSPNVVGAFELPLPASGKVLARIGATTFVVSATPRPRAAAVPLVQFDRRVAAYLGGSLAVHLLVLALLWNAPVDLGTASMDIDTRELATVRANTTATEDPVAIQRETDAEQNNLAGGGETQMATSPRAGAKPEQLAMNEPPRGRQTLEDARRSARDAGILGDEMLDRTIRDLTDGERVDARRGIEDGSVYGPDGTSTGFGHDRSGIDLDGPGGGTVGPGRYDTICKDGAKGCGDGYGDDRNPNGKGPLVRRHVAEKPVVDIAKSITCNDGEGCDDKEIIRRYIKTHREQLQYCYEKELLAHPNLGGDVVIDFFIAPTGGVQGTTVRGFDNAVSTCVGEVFSNINFPKPSSPAGVRVKYGLGFHKAGA